MLLGDNKCGIPVTLCRATIAALTVASILLAKGTPRNQVPRLQAGSNACSIVCFSCPSAHQVC